MHRVVSNSVANCEAVADYYPNQLGNTLVTATLTLLRGVEAAGSLVFGVEALLNVLAEAAVQSGSLTLLNFLLDLFERGRAPRAKYVRQLCASLLGTLLEIAPPSHGKRLEACFLQLAADKVPSVRGVTIPGLALLGTKAAIAAVVEMACSDLACKVRFDALAHLNLLQASFVFLRDLTARCLQQSGRKLFH